MVAPLALISGVEMGSASADREATLVAARLLSSGDDRGAISVDRQLARRGGFVHLLARSDTSGAAAAEQRAALAWATHLARSGDSDHALAVLRSVTDPADIAEARGIRATILLDAAQHADKSGHPDAALARIDELRQSGGPADLLARGETLRPAYAIATAAELTTHGRAVDAVLLLDQVRSATPPPPQAAQAAAALPDTLLAAAREDIAGKDYPEAVALLQRVRSDFPSSRAARPAAGLLGSPVTVTGTLVNKAGSAIAGPVRLGSNFRQTPQGYLTDGPFFYTRADNQGDFTFADVGQGGPYVLEVDRGSGWTTLIDPGSGSAATSLRVAPLNPVDLGFVILPS